MTIDPFAPLGGKPSPRDLAQVFTWSWDPIVPVPDDAPSLPKALMEQRKPDGAYITGSWAYLDGQGRLLGYVVRYDFPLDDGKPKKEFRTFTYCQTPAGKREWRCKGFPEPRPLYGLNRLVARPNAPVIVTEGEKKADAANKRFPEYLAVSPPNGSRSARKTDWSVLAGRSVKIWPDADAPGAAFAHDAVEMLLQAGASTCIVRLPDGLPKGWDLADDLPDGLDEADLAAMLAAAEAVTGGWKKIEPIVSALPPVPPLTRGMLPIAIGGYVFDIAERRQAAPDFAAVAAICAAAAVIGNRVLMAPKQKDNWQEPPNLWGALIGPPSVGKTPSLKSALGPVYAIQDLIREAWQQGVTVADADRMLAELSQKETERKAKQALKNGNHEEAKDLLSAMPKDGKEDAKHCPRIFVNDATVEKLAELLKENPRGLLHIRDELSGMLSRLEKDEFQAERAFYLECYNGSGSYTFDRIGVARSTLRNAPSASSAGSSHQGLPP